MLEIISSLPSGNGPGNGSLITKTGLGCFNEKKILNGLISLGMLRQNMRKDGSRN